MTIKTKYNIGDIVELLGYKDFRVIVTSIQIHADNSISYLIEWNDGLSLRSEWIGEGRLTLLSKTAIGN